MTFINRGFAGFAKCKDGAFTTGNCERFVVDNKNGHSLESK